MNILEGNYENFPFRFLKTIKNNALDRILRSRLNAQISFHVSSNVHCKFMLIQTSKSLNTHQGALGENIVSYILSMQYLKYLKILILQE